MDEMAQKPPAFAVWLLKRFFPDETGLYTQLGDLDEAFNAMARNRGRFAARAWYWLAAARSIPYSIMSATAWSFLMIRHYLKLASNNLRKHRAGSLINVAGLSLGLAFCILTYLFVGDELSPLTGFMTRPIRYIRLWSMTIFTSGLTGVGRFPWRPH